MRRRPYGEGSVSQYRTQQGDRFRINWREPTDPGDPDSPTRKMTRGGFISRKEASLELAKIRTRLDAGIPTIAAKDAFGPYARQWLATRRVARATYASYHRQLTLHAIPYIGGERLASIKPSRLARLYRRLEEGGSTRKGQLGKGLGPNTVRKVHQVIAMVLDQAVEDGIIQVNPARRKSAAPPTTREVKAAKPELVVWSGEEMSAYSEWVRAGDDPLRFLFLTILHTGVRRGEALSVRWRDIDWENSRMAVRRSTTRTFLKGEGQTVAEGPTKNYRSRVVRLSAITVEDLRAQRLLLSGISLSLARPDQHVFVDLDGSELRPDRVLARFHSSQARYNAAHPEEPLPPLHIHGLRHTHATQMLAVGVNPKVAQERLGHSTVSITLDIYSHALETTQQAAVDAYEESFRRDTGTV